jgi:hypothetical protein
VILPACGVPRIIRKQEDCWGYFKRIRIEDIYRQRFSKGVPRLRHPAFEKLDQAAVGTFAVSLMPRAFMTANVVFNVGFPFALKER